MLLTVLISALIISSSALNIDDKSIESFANDLKEYGIEYEHIDDLGQIRALIDTLVNAILTPIINNLVNTYSFVVSELPTIISFNSPLGLDIRGYIAIEEGFLLELTNPAVTAKFSNSLSQLDLSISMDKVLVNSKYQCKYRYGDENEYTSKSGVANLLLVNSSFTSQLNLTVDFTMNGFTNITINSIVIHDLPFDLELESIKLDVTGIIEDDFLNSLVLRVVEEGILMIVDMLKDPNIKEQVETVIVTILNQILDSLFSSSKKSEQFTKFVETFSSYLIVSN